MKKLRLIYLIILCVSSIVMAIIAPYITKELGGTIILMIGMITGALGSLLIILTEYVFPHGLYVRGKKKQHRVL